MSRYINPYTDFGFKKLFGEEASKDLLIDFLNTLLPKKHLVKTLSFRNPEQLGTVASDRRAVFDVYCENAKEEQFIVEMQKAEQGYFKDRSIYYASHPIREQGWRGRHDGKNWDFELKTIYFIGILDFVYDKDDTNPVLIREVSLKDQHGKEFYDKLQFIYIQMPVFNLKESELVTRRDKWLYFLKHLPNLNDIPSIMKEKVFQKAFQKAEFASMPKKERERYEQDLHDHWTYLASLKTAEDKGKTKKAIEIARNLKEKGLDITLIAEMTGLPTEEMERLK